MGADDNVLRSIKGKEVFYSPSSAEEYSGCRARWWLSKIPSLPKVRDATLDFGVAVHLVAEKWLATGVVIGPGTYHEGRDVVTVTPEHIKRVSPSFKDLPPPGSGRTEEWAPRFTVYEGPEGTMRFTGAIDWWAEDATVWGRRDLPKAGRAALVDHKTKGSLSGKYGVPDPETLATNAQANLYVAAINEDRKANGLDPLDFYFAHNYIQSKDAIATKLVITEIDAKDAEARLANHRKYAKQMLVDGRKASHEEVEGNTDYCNAYNRPCPFQGVCLHYQRRKTGGAFSALASYDRKEKPMGLFDRFKTKPATIDGADSASNPPAAPAEPVAPPPAPVAKATGIQPDDVAPHDVEVVSKTHIREIIEVARAQNLEGDDLTALLRREGLNPAWWGNVRALLRGADADPDLAQLLWVVPYDSIQALGEGADTAERAKALAALPDDLFGTFAAASPPDVLLTARPNVPKGPRRKVIDQLLVDGGAITPFDNAEFAEIFQELYWMVRGGVTEDDTLAETVHEWMVDTGRAKKRAPAKIAAILADFRKGLGSAPVGPFVDKPKPAPATPKADPAPTAPAKAHPGIGKVRIDPDALTKSTLSPAMQQWIVERGYVVESPLATRDTFDAIVAGVRMTLPRTLESKPVPAAPTVAPAAPTTPAKIDIRPARSIAAALDILRKGGVDGTESLEALVNKEIAVVDQLSARLRTAATVSDIDVALRAAFPAPVAAHVAGVLAQAPDAAPAAPPATPAGTTLYVGCITEGAIPLLQCDLVQDAIREVEQFVAAVAPGVDWTIWNNFKDNGEKRVAVALRMLISQRGLPPGSYYHTPWTSALKDVPVVEIFQEAGARIVQRVG